jgi:spore photoproduct lyase
LALDPLTAYSTVLIPFFASHPFARLTLLTKSTNIDRLINLESRGHSILSWSVNPPEVCRIFEESVPTIEKRLEAMRRAADAGYPVRAVMMPIIPIDGWREIYADFTRHLLETVPIKRLTMGGICSYKAARSLLEKKSGAGNRVSLNFDEKIKSPDGRARYPGLLRQEIYSVITSAARSYQPGLELALCLEDREHWQAAELENNIGRCNCVW